MEVQQEGEELLKNSFQHTSVSDSQADMVGFIDGRDECSNSNSKSDGDNEGETSGDPDHYNEDQHETEESDYGDSEDEDDIDESEIDLLLEEGLVKGKQDGRKSENEMKGGEAAPERSSELSNGELTIKKIVVLEEKGGNTFEVLPGGWIQVRHSSGLPLYLHRKSRVCSLTKPYFLGTASVRRHSIPLSAVPCLAYRRALEKEQKDKELLELQARELEIQQCEESIPTETYEAASVLTKCLNASNNSKKILGKTASLSVETVAEKVKLLKRKLQLEKGEDSIKREKLEASNSLDLPATNHVVDKLRDDATANDKNEINEIVEFDAPEVASIPNDENDKLDHIKVDSPSAKTDAVPTTNGPGGNGSMKVVRNNNVGVRTLIPLAKVETARENAHLYSITPLDLRDYCKSLFRFQEVECKRFKTWSARRRHTKEQKRKQLERPTLPDNAQVIKFFDISSCKGGGDEQMAKKFNDYVFNPNGKSSVCILHEFVQHALRKQPTYSFQELENAATPYAATVIINEVPYGRGYGSSKKTAKAEAAKATLEILIPQMKGQLNGNKTDTSTDFDITEYFQQVEMNDVRIPKMCTSVSEPSPYTLLLTCLQRNFGQSGSNNVKFEMIPTDPTKGNPPNQFKMTAGNHSVVVTASNKREGKQLASQLLLSEIHPHITNFGAFIKMYGNGSIKSVKEKKQEEQQITTLQSKASANSPNWAILNKLRQEMLKLVDTDNNKPCKSGEEKANKAHDNVDKPSFIIIPNDNIVDEHESNVVDSLYATSKLKDNLSTKELGSTVIESSEETSATVSGQPKEEPELSSD